MVFKIRTFTLPVPRTKEDLLVIHGLPLKRFSLRELKLATNSFSKNFVGRGGFGCVYRGRLADGSVVAVKRNECMDDTHKELEFQTEVEIGGSPALNHRNVVRLRGYCITRKERLLVYPFVVNISVDSWLWNRPQSEPPLDWPTRKRIALGAANGLVHVHSLTVIHRNIKTLDVLLDDKFEAVLSDLGLGKLIVRSGNDSNPNWVQRAVEEEPHDDQDLFEEEDVSDQENKCFTKSCWNFTRTMRLKAEVISESRGHRATYHEFCTHITTSVCGTHGYMPPDYFHTGKCSVKNDVYGYGVVLLELVTGQRAVDGKRGVKDVMLPNWVKRILGDNNLDSLIDPDIGRDYIKEELQQLIKLALSCTEEDPEKRPVMTEVITIIENMGEGLPVDHFLGSEEDLLLEHFSLAQLKSATNDFSNENVMERSGLNATYRGRLQQDGSPVVVKSGRMQFLAQVRHPNLLQLRGYCISEKESLLVYSFMPNMLKVDPNSSYFVAWLPSN